HQLVIEDGDFLLNIRLAVMEEDTPFSTEKERGTERERERESHGRGWSAPPKAPKEPHSRMLVSSLCVTHTCMCVGTWEQHMLPLRLLFISNLYID
ncbi:unnamed protein product, partial [Musa acuminata var. zebrina]